MNELAGREYQQLDSLSCLQIRLQSRYRGAEKTSYRLQIRLHVADAEQSLKKTTIALPLWIQNKY
jgi:hypothetical protein